jgi:hypothetical protein
VNRDGFNSLFVFDGGPAFRQNVPGHATKRVSDRL